MFLQLSYTLNKDTSVNEMIITCVVGVDGSTILEDSDSSRILLFINILVQTFIKASA